MFSCVLWVTLIIYLPTLISSDGSCREVHYKVIAQPDKSGFVALNPDSRTKTKKPFIGPFIDLLNNVSRSSDPPFTYEIRSHERGRRQDPWTRMINSITDGKADIAVGNWAATEDRKEKVDFVTIIDDFSAYVLYNLRFGFDPDKVQYLTKRGINVYLLKESKNDAVKSIYANIKSNRQENVLENVTDAARKVAGGRYAFIADQDTVDQMVADSNGTLVKNSAPIHTGVSIAAFAVEKGSELGRNLQKSVDRVLRALIGLPDSDSGENVSEQEVMEENLPDS